MNRITRAPLAIWLAASASLLATANSAQARCKGLSQPCKIEGGRYYIAEPARWDRKSPISVMLFLHGFGSSGASSLRNRGFARGWTNAGLLFVSPDATFAPDVRKREWAHRGSPNKTRDDLAFLDAVIADIRKRYPIKTVWASGISQGGSMIWDLACHRSASFAGFWAIAGAFWRPMPKSCGAPIRLVHIHGLKDKAVPMKGRVVLKRFRQGNVRKGFEILKRSAGCPAKSDSRTRRGRARCDVYENCRNGRLALCLHGGGHTVPRGWVGRALNEIRAFERSGEKP